MQEYQGQLYQGWSSTYTVSAVLQQLYGFLLLDDSVDHPRKQPLGQPGARGELLSVTLTVMP